MLNIKQYSKVLKQHFKEQHQIKDNQSQLIKELLKTILDVPLEQYLRDFYIKNNKLYLITTHKAFAQELFLQRLKLKNILQTNGHRIMDIIIY